MIIPKLPKRPKDANKGTFGKVLIVAGSKNFPGAAYLCCAAAYRVGVGLTTLATTKPVYQVIGRKIPEVTFISLDSNDQFSTEELEKALPEYDCLLIGPGLGISQNSIKLVKEILRLKNLPKIVIDGDGLNILSQETEWWDKISFNAVLTPHPKEFSRLTNLSVEKIQSSREELVKEYSKKWKQTIVLKGANTIIVSDDQIAIAPFANPLLSTAGTGDVLSGMIAGFVAQGLNRFDASCSGVFVHGQTAENLKNKFGDSGMMASDLLEELPQTIKTLKKQLD